MNEDQVREFEEEIGMRFNPEKQAREALRAYQEAQGMVFDNPDAPVAPDAKSVALAEDEEIGGTWLGGPRRG
jgi:hypothetical protein